ncbi:DUF7168 domain-containing protein [Brevundimonas pondensis]|uniref:DUF2786 domain-containing protein n=1 Tax=Brevundimonas pondensis TaxID=2774189 RepID=A0ABX7SMX3_9CAUL|nr:DUF2786 domain-containing protein [Brevundimonas pondensis]QTC88157.1 DUF2786 domain-containing protein [Brevundimonas pondensis]
MTQGTDREKAAARIRALRAKTVENGCTEAEALAAAEKLAQLLEDYNMTMDEADLRASPFAEQTHVGAGSVGLKLWKVAVAIARLTNTEQWREREDVNRLTFLGLSHEVEIATYLLALCERAMNTEAARHMHGTARWTYGRRVGRLMPFLDGMADRLQRRILSMIPPRPAGTGLIVLHKALVTEELARRGHELEDGGRPRRPIDGASYRAGQAAAERVALNPGLRREQPQGALR